MVVRGNTRSKSRTRTALCLIPRFLRPYRSCGWAENEREYGGDDEERPSGNNGVDCTERWHCPSGDEVPDHTRYGENHAHEAVDAPAHVFVDSVCEEDLPEHFFGSVEHAPDEPEHEYRPQRRV